MKNSFLIISILFIAFTAIAQEKIQHYSKAKIYYNHTSDLQLLMNSGVAVDHGTNKKNVFIESVFSKWELEKAQELGYEITIEIDDMRKHIAHRKTVLNTNNATCGSDYTTPTNFELGSMGGFYTYAQMLSELDQMYALYPNLITAKTQMGTFLTYQNRPIYSVKISNNPTVDENEPEILFSAIHHAREPASMQQLIFYMWYLLENYSTDIEIQGIVDNTEHYFIPILNPDGYVFNQSTDPNGGGFWRKNRRNNGDGSIGVDNNRNYDYHWGEAGVSNNGYGQTWPGAAPFSEKENQAMKWFCEQHNFTMAINNHSHSGLLLYPFGYAVNTPTSEDVLFNGISELMVKENNYTNQLAADLYAAAGDSDDWMYGDTSTKNKIYAMTPEIGHEFWPSQNEIIPLCKKMLHHNITASHLITNYAVVKGLTDELTSLTGNFNYNIKRYGLENSGNFTVTIQPISANILSVGSANSHNGMTLFQTDNASVSYTLNNTIQNGEAVVYKILLDNGLFVDEQIITKTYGNLQALYSDDGNSVVNYNASNWDVTTSDFYSASSSITDSPIGNYTNNLDESLELSNSIDLTNAITAQISFYTKWDIESGWDYVQFKISIDDGVNWIPQCGKYTNNGVANQGIEGEPMYDGIKTNWVKEEIDLSDYLGETIKFKFQIVSDGATTGDGFYFDDFKVDVIQSNPAFINDYQLSNVVVYPNFATNKITVETSNNSTEIDILLYSINGQLLKRIKSDNLKTHIDISTLANGVYVVKIKSKRGQKTVRIIKR
ncbi:MAG: M14 family zinc carboxypeptidase [Flavobacteriaceae bacterium]